MNDLTPFAGKESLPSLIDKATAALSNARTSAEVLEARDMATVAYDAAKVAGRMARVKQAHDGLIAEVHRAQANALAIRARAEMRLAEEYDAAKARGEVASGGYHGNQWAVVDDNGLPTAADLGLRRDEIHEARRLRDAEVENPGLVQRAIDGMMERGEEPTKAALKREIPERQRSRKVMDPMALWIWGRMKDFERDGVLGSDPAHLLAEMTEPMRSDVRRLVPLVRRFLEDLEAHA